MTNQGEEDANHPALRTPPPQQQAGNLKALVSAGQVGFKNARKSQPAAAEKAAEELAKVSWGRGRAASVCGGCPP